MITIVGLGTEAGDLSARGLHAMVEADEVLLRTERLPAAFGLKEAGIQFETLDYLYEKSRNFDTLARNIAKEVKRRAKGKNLCYCVDGGVCEDRAAQLLIQGGGVEVVEGVTKGATAAARAGIGCSYQSVSAFDLAGRKLSLPLVIYDVCDNQIASDAKLLLTEKFGDELPALYLIGEDITELPLYEIDRQERYDERTVIVLPEQELLDRKRFDLDDLMEILRRLRRPDGCPWDKVQTHESIRINAIEEAYELVDALDLDAPEKIQEEAGDVIMQAAFHTLIEEERGNFTMDDVLSGVCEKLITRHTHVFGRDKAQNADGALTVWERNKMTEKGQETYSDAVNDVPACFPALLRAQKIAKRTAKGGWEFTDYSALEQKLREEIGELKAAYEKGDGKEIASELGDVLMCCVRLGRLVGGDCEQALLDTVKKVQKRYTAFERLVLADGKDPTALSPEEWDFYYKRAKDETQGA